jgi:diaminopimelate epimerase
MGKRSRTNISMWNWKLSAVICCNNLGYTQKKVKVIVPGGELFIEITDNGVLMTGPAEIVYTGEIIL